MLHSLLSIDELTFVTGGKIICGKKENAFFTNVVLDSRMALPYSLFVPLIGEVQDGHKYIGQAIEKGSSVVLVSSNSRSVWDGEVNKESTLKKGIVFIEVENTLHALQKAARAYIDKFHNLIKIGVTGSNGKTTTKEMIAKVLQKKYSTVYTQGNLNSETGVPLSVFSLLSGEGHPFSYRGVAVFEMGMNRVNEIGESAEVIRPQKAVITNIGTAHIGILGSKEKIANEKRKILSYADEAFIPYNDEYASFLKAGAKGRVIEFGKDDVTLVRDKGADGMDVKIGDIHCSLSICGLHNLMNISAAVAVGRAAGVEDKDIASALSKIVPIEGRCKVKEEVFTSGAKVKVVQDYYNANPQSMKAALCLCDKTECRGKRIYVLGDMRESNVKESHIQLGRDVALSKADVAVFIGDDVCFAYEEAKNENEIPKVLRSEVTCCRPSASRGGPRVPRSGVSRGGPRVPRSGVSRGGEYFYVKGCTEEAIKKVSSIVLKKAKDGDLLLLKASRGIMLERVETLLTGGTL